MKKQALVFLLACVAALQVSAEVITKDISYKQGDTELKGMLAYDDAITEKRPGVLVVHE